MRLVRIIKSRLLIKLLLPIFLPVDCPVLGIQLKVSIFFCEALSNFYDPDLVCLKRPILWLRNDDVLIKFAFHGTNLESEKETSMKDR